MAAHLFHLDPRHQFLQLFTSNSLLFLAGFRVLCTRSHFGALMIQVDIGGRPPIPFEPPPSVLSIFKFQHNLLFLAVFRVLNFRNRFEALNDVFFGKTGSNMGRCFSLKSFIPRTDLSNEILSASNGDQMQNLHPQEVETPIYPNEAHNVGTSSPRVRLLDVLDFTLFLNNK